MKIQKINRTKTSKNKKQPKYHKNFYGNTLVPVIIALAISAIATIAFLNKGANLTSDTKLVLAQNEINEMMYQYSLLRTQTTLANIGDSFTGVLALGVIRMPQTVAKPRNVYGNQVTYRSIGTRLEYPTPDSSTCTALVTILDSMDLVDTSSATGSRCNPANGTELFIEVL